MSENENCCQGCDLVEDAAGLGIIVHGHEEKGCGLSAAQKQMLAARVEDHRNALAEQTGPALR
jgi:hypothetical protein